MTGDAAFDEVYLDGVAVDDDQRIGAVGDGWRVVLTMLLTERLHIAGRDGLERGSGPIGAAVRAAKVKEPGAVERDRLARLWAESEAIRLATLRLPPGPAGALAKLAATRHMQAVFQHCVDAMGPEGMLLPRGYEMRVFDDLELDGEDLRWWFLESRGRTIGGGTSEVLRTSLGEQVLGLPAEPRVARDVAWRELLRP